MFFFFFDDENKSNDKQVELHYLSNSISYGVDKIDSKEFFDSLGKLEKKESKDDSQNEFKESDFKRLISEKVRKTIYGEKYSNIVFLAGAGASVVGGNRNYGKTVKMIADDVFEKLHGIDELYTLEELAEMGRYKDGKILDFTEFESSEKHGALLKFLSDLSGKDGNKFSVITTNYDVLIEEAASENNFVIFDGFNFTPLPNFDSNMFEWNLVKEIQNVNTREVEYKDKTFNLVKIHGSLTWEKQDNGDIVRKNKDSITETDKMVMVFPSSDKFAQSYQEPYFELFTKFQELIKRPNTLLISSGFSFADDHISKMITQALKNNSSLKLLVTDFNIDPNRQWDETNKQYDEIVESDTKYNKNWGELIHLMNEGYPISFLKATMNSDLVDYLSGRYLNDEN